MEIIIDSRETHLIKYITENVSDFKYASKQLEVGDILVKKNGASKVLIERKTIEDLASSITDGRYKEQKHRLLEFATENGCKIVYILEGSKKWRSALADSTLMGVMVNSSLRDNVYIINTRDIADTFLAIKKVYLYYDTKETLISPTYEEVVVKTHKKVHSPKLCFLEQLSIIPSISIKTAEAIASTFANMSALIKGIESGDIDKVMVGNKKINKTILKNLREYVH